jgi:hypothetical protein
MMAVREVRGTINVGTPWECGTRAYIRLRAIACGPQTAWRPAGGPGAVHWRIRTAPVIVNLQSSICNLRFPMDSFPVTCPYCGELVELYVEPDVRGSFVQDCEVCCNPWRVRVSRADGERTIDIAKADGSE